MKVHLKRTDSKYQMVAANENGQTGTIDGGGSALSPMQTLLSAVAACTVVDIVDILAKQKQELRDIKIETSGEREELEMIKPFKTIHLHYKLYGNINDKKAQRAIDLAFNKYCSVSASLNKSIVKTFSFEVINE